MVSFGLGRYVLRTYWSRSVLDVLDGSGVVVFSVSSKGVLIPDLILSCKEGVIGRVHHVFSLKEDNFELYDGSGVLLGRLHRVMGLKGNRMELSDASGLLIGVVNLSFGPTLGSNPNAYVLLDGGGEKVIVEVGVDSSGGLVNVLKRDLYVNVVSDLIPILLVFECVLAVQALSTELHKPTLSH